jgi:RNA polymerase-binding protein DksA
MDATIPADAEARLRAEREHLCHQLKDIGATEAGELRNDVEFDDAFADAAAATSERTEVLGLVENLHMMLEAVDEALAAIEAGTYGICVKCGKEIGEGRLEFRPASIECVSCKSAG